MLIRGPRGSSGVLRAHQGSSGPLPESRTAALRPFHKCWQCSPAVVLMDTRSVRARASHRLVAELSLLHDLLRGQFINSSPTHPSLPPWPTSALTSFPTSRSYRFLASQRRPSSRRLSRCVCRAEPSLPRGTQAVGQDRRSRVEGRAPSTYCSRYIAARSARGCWVSLITYRTH